MKNSVSAVAPIAIVSDAIVLLHARLILVDWNHSSENHPPSGVSAEGSQKKASAPSWDL